MGKKIKGKKHRTVRYPEQQKRVRELALYHKVNNPPKIIDDQEVPKNVRKIKEFKENLKVLEEKYERKQLEKKKRKIQKKSKDKTNINRGKLLEKLLIKEGEGEKTIVINETRPIKKKTTTESLPYQIVTKTNTPVNKKIGNSGIPKINKTLINELGNDYPSLRKCFNINNNKNEPKVKKSKKLSKKQKDKIKQREKETEEIEEKDMMYDPVYDKVEFGETVHAPPKFTKRPRNTEIESKPGKKNNLLLVSILNPDIKPQLKVASKFDYTPDLKGKRKELSIADRRRLDKEQEIAIAAYKRIKAEKWKTLQNSNIGVKKSK